MKKPQPTEADILQQDWEVKQQYWRDAINRAEYKARWAVITLLAVLAIALALAW